MGGKDLQGRPASEEEVAKALGFNSVDEFRRWNTDTGRMAAEAEHRAQKIKGEADRFRWAGRRMDIVLEKVEELLSVAPKLPPEVFPPDKYEKLLLALKVVRGKGVDWQNVLDDWLYPDGPPGEEAPNVFKENAQLREALLAMWEWQKTCQELLPDPLTDKVKKLLNIE